MVAAPPIPWNRERFLIAVENGLFGEASVELLEGEVYEVVSESHPHRLATMLLLRALAQAFGDGFLVRSEMGLPMGRSQPKSDLSVIHWDPEALRRREPGSEDAVLLVEVVATRPDTAGLKREIYARAGIPEYWILDVDERTLSVYRSPSEQGYRESQTLGESESITVASKPLRVSDLLP